MQFPYCLDEELKIQLIRLMCYGLEAKRPNPGHHQFLSVKGHGHTATPIHLQILCGCTPTARADRSCGTDYPAHKAKNIYSVAPFRSLLSFDFAVDGEPLNWFQQKILIRFVFTVKNGSEKVRPGAESVRILLTEVYLRDEDRPKQASGAQQG